MQTHTGKPVKSANSSVADAGVTPMMTRRLKSAEPTMLPTPLWLFITNVARIEQKSSGADPETQDDNSQELEEQVSAFLQPRRPYQKFECKR